MVIQDAAQPLGEASPGSWQRLGGEWPAFRDGSFIMAVC